MLSPPTSELSIFTGSSVAEYRRREYEQYQCRHQALSVTKVDQLSEVCKRYLSVGVDKYDSPNFVALIDCFINVVLEIR